MRKKQLFCLAATAVLLTACGGRDPKPDSYWMDHPTEAASKKQWCIDHHTDMAQAARTKPQEAMTADERECLFLFESGEYERKRAYEESKQRLKELNNS